MFGLFRTRCQLCAVGFKNKSYRWKFEGKSAWLCPNCNATMEKRMSAAAFGRPVEVPTINYSSGGFGKVLGCSGLGFVALIFLAVIFSQPNDADTEAKIAPVPERKNQASKSDAAPKVKPIGDSVATPEVGNQPIEKVEQSPETAQPAVANVGVPLFAEPTKAARVPISLGLTDISTGKPAWRNSEIGWYGQSEITTFKGGFTKVGDVDNTITCMHSSSTEDRVEFVRWTANIFNTADSVTAARFKELCMLYVQKLGCHVPATLFEGVDPAKGQFLETSEATFELKRLTYNLGFGWQFTVTAK